MRTYEAKHRKRGVPKAKVFTSKVRANNLTEARDKMTERLKHKHTVIGLKLIRK